MSATLTVRDLVVGYDQADVLSGVSLRIAPGKVTCLLGANGSGKTTLIRAILGLTPARAGTVALDGAQLGRRPTHEVVAAGIACIPEGRRAFPKISVEENLRLGAYLEKDASAVAARLEQVYTLFPRLRERSNQLAGTMSGGEQAMLCIGRGLMASPKLLLIDEPSLGLSPLYVKETFNVIRRINEQGVTIFLVEQNVHQTMAVSHYGYVLAQGRVVAEGDGAALKASPELHAAYFG